MQQSAVIPSVKLKLAPEAQTDSRECGTPKQRLGRCLIPTERYRGSTWDWQQCKIHTQNGETFILKIMRLSAEII